MQLDIAKIACQGGSVTIKVILNNDGSGHVQLVTQDSSQFVLHAFAGGSWPALVAAINNADAVVKELQNSGRMTAFRFP